MTVHPRCLVAPETDLGLLLYYERSGTIYHQGDEAHNWYRVIRGVVRTCIFSQDGQRQITAFYYAGDLFGADDGLYSETAEAVTDVLVRCRRRAPALQLDEPGEELRDATHLLRSALNSARRSMVLLGRKTAQQRVAAFLLTLPQNGAEPRGRTLPMSRADIADHLGLTLHTVSRTLAELARRGLVAFSHRQVTILDPGGLQDLIGEELPEPLPGAGAVASGKEGMLGLA